MTRASDTATKPSTEDKARTATATKPTAAGAKAEARAGAGVVRDNGPTGAEAMTGVRAGAAPAQRELSADQVKQLQSALERAGCYTGTADGVDGRGTQRAVACGLKKYKLAAGDTEALYRKLGLKF